MDELLTGVWRWTTRHPEWHPRGSFGAAVASFAVRHGDGTLLVDPLVPRDGGDEVVSALDRIVDGPVRVLVTIPYHVRSAEPLWGRYRDSHEATIWGHPALAKRLTDPSGFRAVRGGVPLDGGIVPITIGNPRRYETPYYLPGCDALVFGDAVVESDGALRVWIQRPITPERVDWYEHRLRPSLEPLLEVGAERVLVTHGEPLLHDGAEALAAALAAGPWYHPPH